MSSLFIGEDAPNVIRAGTERGLRFGFTLEDFGEESYLWEEDKTITASLIMSANEGRGNVRRLFDAIESAGYRLKVPTPSNRMRMICERRGMVSTWEPVDIGDCEFMVRPQSNREKAAALADEVLP